MTNSTDSGATFHLVWVAWLSLEMYSEMVMFCVAIFFVCVCFDIEFFLNIEISVGIIMVYYLRLRKTGCKYVTNLKQNFYY